MVLMDTFFLSAQRPLNKFFKGPEGMESHLIEETAREAIASIFKTFADQSRTNLEEVEIIFLTYAGLNKSTTWRFRVHISCSGKLIFGVHKDVVVY
jgi:hypothetical protein